jgi:thymidylate synthase ThyX
MLDTIQSSFEFVEYTFKISDVPRSFTHQLVRTRTGSYAQESQRTVDVRNAGCEWPYDYVTNLKSDIFEAYGWLIDEGVQVQDAREILPIGTHTSIIAKFNLRTLHDMALVRLCTRTAGMYQSVFKEIKRLVVEKHPWAEDFLQVHCSWYGTCAFPRYEACPVQQFTINKIIPEAFRAAKSDCRRMIDLTEHVANPIAKNGMSMATTEEDDCE